MPRSIPNLLAHLLAWNLNMPDVVRADANTTRSHPPRYSPLIKSVGFEHRTSYRHVPGLQRINPITTRSQRQEAWSCQASLCWLFQRHEEWSHRSLSLQFKWPVKNY